MSGPYAGADINASHPVHIDQLATSYPKLKIVLGQMIGWGMMARPLVGIVGLGNVTRTASLLLSRQVSCRQRLVTFDVPCGSRELDLSALQDDCTIGQRQRLFCILLDEQNWDATITHARDR